MLKKETARPASRPGGAKYNADWNAAHCRGAARKKQGGPTLEEVAFAIYREFIRHGIGTCLAGRWGQETSEEACARRWERLPAATRDSFLREAYAAIAAVEGATS